MKAFHFLKKAIPMLALSFFLVPSSAHAGPLADAFDATVSQSQFSYDAKASITLEKGGESDAPFDLELSVREEGGKLGGVYGKDGAIWGEVRNIDDLPRELQGLNVMNMMLEYGGAHIESSKTSFGEVKSLSFSADHEEMNQVMGMMNQMAKFFTGKSFKISQDDIINSLRDLVGGDSFYGPSEEEVFLSALSGGNQSIAELVSAAGNFVDAMVESGFMKMEVVQGSHLRQDRLRATGGTTYVLTLGDAMTPRGGEIFRDALAEMLSTLMPGLGEMIAEDLGRESGETIANDLNDLLALAGQVEMSLEINVSNGTLRATDFVLDLSGINVPLRVEEQVSFEYSNGYSAYIPNDDNQIIDLNEIFEGMMVLAEMGSSSYDSYTWDETWENTAQSEYELPTDSYVYNDVQYILSVCGSDKVCQRREMTYVMQSLRSLKEEGFLDGREFAQAVRDLKKGLR